MGTVCDGGGVLTRHGRAPCRSGARQLAHVPAYLRLARLQPARRDRHGQRPRPQAPLDVLHGAARRPPGAAGGERRGDVRHHALQPRAGPGRRIRRPPLALPARPAGRPFPDASDQPGGGAARQPRVHGDSGLLPRRARCADRGSRVGGRGRGLRHGLLHDPRAPGRQGQGDGRGFRRRVRHPGLRGGVRRRDRGTGLEDVYDPCSGRARQRVLGRGLLEDGRRTRLAHGQLRFGHGHLLLGHREWGTLDRGRPPRGQSVRDIGPGARRRDRRAHRLSPVPLERLVGLGRGVRAAPDRLHAGRPHDPGPGACGPQRLPVVPRARTGRDRFRGREAVRAPGRLHRARPGDGPAVLRRVEEARRRPGRDLLPVALGRQGLAAGRVLAAHAAPLHPRQRQHVRAHGGRGAGVPARTHVHGQRRGRGPDHHRRGRHVPRGAAGLERRHVRGGLERAVREPQLGPCARHRGRPGVPGRHQRPLLPRLRRP